MSFSARGAASTPILILIEGCCGLGVRARGAFGFSNEKSFTYCISTPICGTGVCGAPVCGAGPPFVVDIVISAWPAWLTCAGAANNAGKQRRLAVQSPGPHRFGTWRQSATSALDCWRSRADRLMFERGRAKMTANRHWMALPACLHRAGTGVLPWFGHSNRSPDRTVPLAAMAKE